MGIFAAILGGIGGLSGVLGIITALDVLEDPIITKLGSGEYIFWFLIGALLLLGSIAMSLGKGESVE
jgi:hypothetical protein